MTPEVQAAFDRAPCGLLATSDDGTVRRSNQVFCNWLGYTCDELVGKRRLQDLLTMGGKIFHQTHWAPLLRMQGSLSEVKLELVHRDGSVIPMVLNAIRGERDGELVHEIAAFVARDRDRYERELVLSRKRLEAAVAEANQLRDEARNRAQYAEQMIGIVSHDLRTPLSTIGVATDLLSDADEATRKRLLGQIDRAVERANGLIVDLLDFTQARVGGGLSVTVEPVDLHAAVGEALEGLRVAYPRQTIEHLRDGRGHCAIDVNRLAQLVGNLVANAVAYGRPGAPIDVRTIVGESAGTVSVTNQGDPIPAAVLPTVFQPLKRGTNAPSKARSVGLGLFIVQEIAKAHGGSASVRSTVSEGTTFLVTFPRSPD